MVSIQHVRPSRSLRFASTDPEWDLGQSSRHLNLCFLLRELLLRAVTANDTVGMDAFTYFDPTDDEKKCAPDAFVKLGVANARFASWTTWDRGAPELCVEILSPSDTKEKLSAKQKLARFEAMGVKEVVFFDVDAPPGARLRAWDLVKGALVERRVTRERTRSKTLGRWFHVGPTGDEPVALFLADDEAAASRILTNDEARRVAEEGRRMFEAKWLAAEEARAAAEARATAEARARLREAKAREAEAKAREAEAKARRTAEARVRELEALLRAKKR